MLEDQLLQVSRLQNNRKLVEAADLAGKLDPSHQIDRNIDAILSKIVQKGILYILRIKRAVIHDQSLIASLN